MAASAMAVSGCGTYVVLSMTHLFVPLEVSVALAFAVWTGWLMFAATRMVGAVGHMSVSTIAVPMLIPEHSNANDWVQPEVEKGDRLMEAEMVDDDGESARIVVLVKPNGIVKGYSGPLSGQALRLAISPEGDLPPEPT
jgi:hypothetical protein